MADFRKVGDHANPEETSPETHITQDGDYYVNIKGTWYEAELSYLGTPIIGERVTSTPANLDTSPPAKWGEGFKSNKRLEYPLAAKHLSAGTAQVRAHGVP